MPVSDEVIPAPRRSLPPSFTFSQSSLQDYSDCARRFELKYMEELAWPAVQQEPALEVESRQREALLFHRMVQQRLLGLPDSRLTTMAQNADTVRWWQNFLLHAPDLSEHTVHTEQRLVARVGSHRLVSKYDCIALRSGEAMIVDWKTYARRPREEDLAARWQTRVYRSMLVRAGSELNGGVDFEPAAVSMLYWLAEFPTEPIRLRYDEPQFKRDWAAIEAMVAEISRARQFPLTSDASRCRFCTYRSLCDRGETARDWRDAEDDAPVDTGFELNFEQIGEIEY